ncbi:BglG family transcription antiterminator [Listeria welshimeri]|uniref:BglG family transcription antiterminator n=1 Tax=Listeria welshimeri TaxID=1643 RepID=UPI0018873A99|nr:BglG family transcription antiterminator [Listeria welshimeri]MBF2596373.1 transcription antiterminator [Listeria welshimeri]
MYMDERSLTLLQEVLKNPSISNQRLGEKFHLTRRQVSYSFKKINEWLLDNNYSSIQKNNQGHFLVDPNVTLLLSKKDEADAEKEYLPTEKERVHLLLLMILTSETALSTSHFTSALQFSKATIMRDIKMLQQLLKKEDLEILYTRQNGYQVIGDEWQIRRKMMELIAEVHQMFHGDNYLRKFTSITKETIQQIYEKIERVEKKLELKFTDEKIFILPYVFASMLRRIEMGKGISSYFQINYNELSDTNEYQAVEILLEGVADLAEEERLYMALQLLTSNVSYQSVLTENQLPWLNRALDAMLTILEEKALIQFKNRVELVEKLSLHMKPAYYRIKYHLTTSFMIPDVIHEEFNALHFLVKESIWPLENFIGETIPDEEIYFITLFIGGHLIKTGEITQHKKPSAIVICPNGVSISKLIESQLAKLFPEFHFWQTMSIREFEKTAPNVDVVFSVTPVETTCKLYIMSHYMSFEEQQRLRQRVMNEVFHVITESLDLEQLLARIEQHVEVTDRSNLKKELYGFFQEKDRNKVTDFQKEEIEYCLEDLMSSNMTRVVKSVPNWHTAIELTAAPLLEAGFIDQTYVNAMKSLYPEIAPYIVLRGNILLPHARPEDGVNKFGLSILKVEDGLIFNGKKIHLLVVLAPVDKKKHLTAMFQLLTIASNQQVIDKLKNATSGTAICQIFKENLTK